MVLSLNRGKSIIFRNIHLFSQCSFFSPIAQQKDPRDTLARFSLLPHLPPFFTDSLLTGFHPWLLLTEPGSISDGSNHGMSVRQKETLLSMRG